jgi:sulfur relay (sulfurtransferase) DsrF/TusC family protein
MKKIIVLITHPPFGHENTFAGLYVGLASLSKVLDVTVVFNCDGAFNALKDEGNSMELLNLPSIKEQIGNILELGGRCYLHRESAERRGVLEENIFEGIEMIDDKELTDVFEQYGELVVTF